MEKETRDNLLAKPGWSYCGKCDRVKRVAVMYRCFFCKLYYCEDCAKEHFGIEGNEPDWYSTMKKLAHEKGVGVDVIARGFFDDFQKRVTDISSTALEEKH
jgi:hypothetical protein